MFAMRTDQGAMRMKKAFGFMTLAAALSLGAAEPYPNPHRIVRYLDAEASFPPPRAAP